jgi:beta-lactamase class A
MTGSLSMRALVAAVALATLVPSLPAAEPETLAAEAGTLPRLEKEIARIAGTVDGDVGVAALHLESGRRVAYRADVRFPMASVYKIPIAVQVLGRAGRGEIDLDSLVDIGPHDIRPGSGVIAELFALPGVRLSVENLLRCSLMVSDNNAPESTRCASIVPRCS